MPTSQASPSGSRKRRLSPQPDASATMAPPVPASTTSTAAVEAEHDQVASAPDSTPKKRGRTNTPWSAEEEQRLKAMRDAGRSWNEIAKVRALLAAATGCHSP